MSPATYTPPPAPAATATPDVAAWVGASRLTRATKIHWEEQHNDLGSWSLTIPNIPGPAEAEHGWIDYGTVVTFRELGTVSFVGVVEEITSTTVARGEGPGQATTYSGRSILAELDRAIVQPRPLHDWVGWPLDGLRLSPMPYPETMWWNYATPHLDRSTWTNAVEIVQAGQTPPLWPPLGYLGAPTPWPYPPSWWIAPRAISGGAHPPGDWYATGTVTTSGAWAYDMFVAVGFLDEGWVWYDGDLVAHIDGPLQPRRIRLSSSDGAHRIVVKVRHGGSNSTSEITGLNVSFHRHYPDGSGLTSGSLASTSASWKVLDIGEPTPGFTLDEIGSDLITMAQGRTALPGWSPTFGGGEDTLGEDMPRIVEFGTPTGNKVIDAFKELAEDHIEFRASFSSLRDLDMWSIPGNPIPGGTATGGGTVTGIALVPGTNVDELTHHGTAAEVTAMLTRWDAGLVEAYGSVEPNPRLEGYLSIPQTTDGTVALYTGLKNRERLASPSESIEGLRHRVKAGLVYRAGDWVTAPNRAGAMVAWRVVGRAVDADSHGRGTVTATLGVARDTEQARIDRWQRRQLGTLDGRSEQARPSSPWVTEVRSLTSVRMRFSTGGAGVTIIGDRGTPDRPDQTLLVVGFELECDVAGTSGATTIRLEKNAVSIGTATLPSSQNWGYSVLSTPVILTVLDQLNVETTAAGGHQGITATAICMATE